MDKHWPIRLLLIQRQFQLLSPDRNPPVCRMHFVKFLPCNFVLRYAFSVKRFQGDPKKSSYLCIGTKHMR